MFVVSTMFAFVAVAFRCPTFSVSKLNSSLSGDFDWNDTTSTVFVTTEGQHVYELWISRDNGRSFAFQPLPKQREPGEVQRATPLCQVSLVCVSRSAVSWSRRRSSNVSRQHGRFLLFELDKSNLGDTRRRSHI